MFPFISISRGTSVPYAGMDVLFVKQWYTTAPNRLPTKNDTTDEVMIDTAITTPVFSGPAVIPENTMQSHTTNIFSIMNLFDVISFCLVRSCH